MQTPQLIKVKVQDTPIRSIRLEWWEGTTWHVCEIPVSWALRVFGFDRVTDRMVNSADHMEALTGSIEDGAARYIQAIREDYEYSRRIAAVECSDESIPAIFQTRAA